MFKNKSLIIATLIVIILGTVSLLYFKNWVKDEEVYNVVVINNTGEDIKSIGYEAKNSAGGTIKADNSMIHDKEKSHLNLEEEKFKISITDKDDKNFLSQDMIIDLKDGDKKYEVLIEKNKNDKYTFKIREMWI